MRFLLALPLFVLFVCNISARAFVPTSQYVGYNLRGWTVRINRHLLTDESPLGNQAVTLLQAKLGEIENSVPSSAVAKLKSIPIWLGVNDGFSPCAEYHPSSEWLASHGYNPDKGNSLEIGNAQRFIEWSRTQPSMILHELAHGYYFRYLSYAYADIHNAYERALLSKAYDSVPRNNGRRERAYAMTNEKEYFAESTESFFGTNDFYPFNRKELAVFDPQMFQLLARVWGVT